MASHPMAVAHFVSLSLIFHRLAGAMLMPALLAVAPTAWRWVLAAIGSA